MTEPSKREIAQISLQRYLQKIRAQAGRINSLNAGKRTDGLWDCFGELRKAIDGAETALNDIRWCDEQKPV